MAQKTEVVKQNRLDSTYVEDYTEWLTTRLFILYQDAEFTVSSSSFFYDVSQFRVWGGMRFDVFRKQKKNNS